MPVTWKNVSAPNLGPALSAIDKATQRLSAAGTGIGNTLKDLGTTLQDNTQREMLNELLIAGNDPTAQRDVISRYQDRAFAPDPSKVFDIQQNLLKNDLTAKQIEAASAETDVQRMKAETAKQKQDMIQSILSGQGILPSGGTLTPTTGQPTGNAPEGAIGGPYNFDKPVKVGDTTVDSALANAWTQKVNNAAEEIATSGYADLSSMTTKDLYDRYTNDIGRMPSTIPLADKQNAMLNAYASMGVDVSQLNSKDTAIKDTQRTELDKWTDIALRNPEQLGSNPRLFLNENTALTNDAISTIVSPIEYRKAFNEVMADVVSDPKFGMFGPDGAFSPTEAGVQKINPLIEKKSREYPYVDRKRLSNELSSALGLASAQKELDRARTENKTFAEQDSKHANKVNAERRDLRNKYNASNTFQKFKGEVKLDKIRKVADDFINRYSMFGGENSWIVYKAMQDIGGVDADFGSYNDFQTGSAGWIDQKDYEIEADILKTVADIRQNYLNNKDNYSSVRNASGNYIPFSAQLINLTDAQIKAFDASLAKAIRKKQEDAAVTNTVPTFDTGVYP